MLGCACGHHPGWFSGLSSLFLGTPCPKLLILAGTDRLDRELTIAQMQGKFQMNVVYGAGHVLQEDCPDKACDVLRTFLTHHLLLPDREVPPAVANSIDKQ